MTVVDPTLGFSVVGSGQVSILVLVDDGRRHLAAEPLLPVRQVVSILVLVDDGRRPCNDGIA